MEIIGTFLIGLVFGGLIGFGIGVLVVIKERR